MINLGGENVVVVQYRRQWGCGTVHFELLLFFFYYFESVLLPFLSSSVSTESSLKLNKPVNGILKVLADGVSFLCSAKVYYIKSYQI